MTGVQTCALPIFWAIVDALVDIGAARGVSAAQVALAWLLGRKGVTSVIIGGRTEAQFKDNLAAADLKLKVSEYLGIWAGVTIGTPFVFLFLSIGLPALRSPIALLLGLVLGFFLPRFWLGRRKSSRLNAFNKQQIGRAHV